MFNSRYSHGIYVHAKCFFILDPHRSSAENMTPTAQGNHDSRIMCDSRSKIDTCFIYIAACETKKNCMERHVF